MCDNMYGVLPAREAHGVLACRILAAGWSLSHDRAPLWLTSGIESPAPTENRLSCCVWPTATRKTETLLSGRVVHKLTGYLQKPFMDSLVCAGVDNPGTPSGSSTAQIFAEPVHLELLRVLCFLMVWLLPTP